MFILSKPDETSFAVPFRDGEEAWFWTMATILARRDGAGAAWRPEGPARPCDPDDVIKCLNSMYERRGVALFHARILRLWGERQVAPDPYIAAQAEDARLWQQAMGQLEWALRGRGIVR